ALGRGDALSLLAAYGIPAGDAAGPALRVSVADDALFGPAITIESPQGGATDLPPLNLPLATCLAGRAGLTGPVAERAAACL
ncbi:hypothetical protein ACEV99_22810, partial [Vibrio parahaemolyticus]